VREGHAFAQRYPSHRDQDGENDRGDADEVREPVPAIAMVGGVERQLFLERFHAAPVAEVSSSYASRPVRSAPVPGSRSPSRFCSAKSRYNSKLCGYSRRFMLITHGSSDAVLPAVALTVGNFDGIHRGHQTMLQRLIAGAQARPDELRAHVRAPSARVFRAAGGTHASDLIARETRVARGARVERAHVQRFDRPFAALAPEAFAEQCSRNGSSAPAPDRRGLSFRSERAGDLALLKELGAFHGYEVENHADGDARRFAGIQFGGTRRSRAGDSSRPRRCSRGPTASAVAVVHGRKLGRELGFATANVQLKHNRPPLTRHLRVKVHGIGAAARPAVASLGVRPRSRRAGARAGGPLVDFSEDLYAAHVRVEFLHKIRDEEKYPISRP